MQKRKKLFGRIGLVFVALMTIFAYQLPTVDAYATGSSHTDVIRVTVYDQHPGITIKSPENDATVATPTITVTFDYENAEYIEFVASYVDENGATQTVTVGRYDPATLDPTFNYASETGATIELDLAAYGLDYAHFILHAYSTSAIGYDEDSIEFDFAPTVVTQTGTDAESDPIVKVDYDDGVARVELMVYDKNGNPIYDEPIVINVTPDESGNFHAGSETLTLPFTSYGLETGDYVVVATSYSRTNTSGDPDNPVYEYNVIDSALGDIDYRTSFPIEYVRPKAPDVPDTGRFLGNLNLAKSDYIITAVIVFVAAVLIASVILSRKKKDYRKNLKRR